ncbi:MAG: hypothetical protein ACTSQG_10595 [Promethearchaeota archaeon]
MGINLSLTFGVPTNLLGAKAQHKYLVFRLKNNQVFMLPSQNRGYLVLKAGTGRYKNIGFFNILQKSKPKGKFIMVTKV